MGWFVDRVLPGLIDSVPFILICGFGWHWHKRVMKDTMDASNQRANNQQTHELVTKLKGPRE